MPVRRINFQRTLSRMRGTSSQGCRHRNLRRGGSTIRMRESRQFSRGYELALDGTRTFVRIGRHKLTGVIRNRTPESLSTILVATPSRNSLGREAFSNRGPDRGDLSTRKKQRRLRACHKRSLKNGKQFQLRPQTKRIELKQIRNTGLDFDADLTWPPRRAKSETLGTFGGAL